MKYQTVNLWGEKSCSCLPMMGKCLTGKQHKETFGVDGYMLYFS